MSSRASREFGSGGSSHRDHSEQTRLERQVDALRAELAELATQYEEALTHVKTLEAQRAEAEQQRQSLKQATVRIALLVEELEVREQKYRAQAESLEQTTSALNEAHRKLLAAHDILRSERTSQEIHLRRMEHELESAGTVQRMLIPEMAPADVPGLELSICYIPATEASGDWLGFWRNETGNELSILIGDVTGHGLGSALVTAGVFSANVTLDLLLNMLQAYGVSDEFCQGFREPSAFLDLLDSVVGSVGKNLLPMTFFAATFNSENRTLRYANAGHCFPLLLGERDWAEKKSQGARMLLAKGNHLGTQQDGPKQSRKELVQQLEKNDLLLFYTDSLIESRDRRNRQIGIRRVVSWLRELYGLPIDAIRDALRLRYEEYIMDSGDIDDLAFIVARVTD